MAKDGRTERLVVRVTPAGLAALDAVAEAEDVPRSTVVRRALAAYLATMPAPVSREAHPVPKTGAR